jgi:hypothetical protein
MPGNLQLCSERCGEDELAAALKCPDEQEIRTARHIPPNSMPAGAMFRFFTTSLSLHPNSTLEVSDTTRESFDNKYFANLEN